MAIDNNSINVPQSGIAFMVIAMFIVPMGDVLSKLATAHVLPAEAAFWRFVIQAVILGVAARLFRQKLRGVPMGMMVLGGLSSATSLVCLIGAFSLMPIATAIAIFFVEPLVLTVFSVLFLGEKAGWRRFTAVAVGLCGAVIVIRPSWSDFGWVAVLPLIAAVAFAGNMVVIRKVSDRVPGLTVQFWFGLFAALALGVGLGLATMLGWADWRIGTAVAASGPQILVLLAGMGLMSSLSYFLISEAFRRSAASLLAPFQYLEIIGAVALGYMVFGTFPDALTWLGLAIILASGFYVFYREQKLQRAARTVAADR